MRPFLSLSTRVNRRLVIALLTLFVGVGFWRFSGYNGDDLAASYLGCRLIASGDSAHLYAHDSHDFAAVGEDDEWQAAADEAHFDSWLHPYVQTPLWAWSLQPLCRRMYFPPFVKLFTLLILTSFATLIWIVARAWAPLFRHPLAMLLLIPPFWFSTPFKYAIVLMQTHIFFVLFTVAALQLAQCDDAASAPTRVHRGRALAAGILLALAAAIKLTPAIFLLYWFVTRRWRAATTFVLVSAILLVAAIFATGRPLFAEYLATLHRVSNTLLLSQNNQSLAAWWMSHFYPASEVNQLNIHPLPAALRIFCTALAFVSALATGLLDRRSHVAKPGQDPEPNVPANSPASARPPLGALFLLVATTLLTPIAWTHYSIVLLPALMVLTDVALRQRSLVLAAVILVMLVLNLPPLASDVISNTVGPHAIVRSQFFAGVLCLVSLAAVALSRRFHNETRPALT